MWNGPAQKHHVLLINRLPLYSLQGSAVIHNDRYRLPTALQHEPAEVAPLGLLRASPARAPRLGAAARVTRQVALKRPVGSC